MSQINVFVDQADTGVADSKTLLHPDGTRKTVEASDVSIYGSYNAGFGEVQFYIEITDEGIVDSADDNDAELEMDIVKSALEQLLSQPDHDPVFDWRLDPDSLEVRNVARYGGRTRPRVVHTPVAMLSPIGLV